MECSLFSPGSKGAQCPAKHTPKQVGPKRLDQTDASWQLFWWAFTLAQQGMHTQSSTCRAAHKVSKVGFVGGLPCFPSDA